MTRKRVPASPPGAAPASGEGGVAGFEASMKRLEEIVRALDGDEVSLEDSIRLYEEGMGLYRRCREILEEAELKVRRLGEALDEADAGPEADE